jgi:hypothetical protein
LKSIIVDALSNFIISARTFAITESRELIFDFKAARFRDFGSPLCSSKPLRGGVVYGGILGEGGLASQVFFVLLDSNEAPTVVEAIFCFLF